MHPTDEALGAWIDDEMAARPTLASALGVAGHDDRLDDLSAAAWQAREVADRRWAARLDGLIATTDDPDAQADLTMLLAELAGRAVLAGWEPWRRDPDLYVQPVLKGVHEPFLHRLRPDAELVADVVARLGEVPAVVTAARANLDPELTPRLLVERGLDAARAGAAYVRDLLAESVDDPGLQADLGRAGAAAAEQLDDLAAHLAGLAERARGDWALGEERYSGLLRTRELLDFDAAGVHDRGEAALAALDVELTEAAARAGAAGRSWQQLVRDLSADHPADPEGVRVAYEASCQEARAFLVERALVTLPDGERLLVEPSPLFERPLLAVASYSGPAPFSTSRVGRFFVPWPPEGTTADELEQRLADNAHHAIPTTAVHEAYPGHHWQLTWSAATPRPLRKVLWSSYFVEGWALYAEKMMHEQGFFTDPRQVVCHLDARAFRAARMVVDTALHCGEMTVEQAVEFMSTRATLTPAVARAEVDRYCSWPTQAPSYLTGSLEIERMRDRWFAEGRGDLRAFHDTVAANPGMPLPLTERVTFGA